MKKYSLNQKLIAESIGTFALTAVVLASIAVREPAFPTPVLAAITLAVFVFIIGKISGAHINPAVTLGLVSIKEMEIKTALKYITAQVGGAFAAYLLLTTLIPDVKLPVNEVSTFAPGFGEILGVALFTFGIASVVFDKKASNIISSFVIGASLLLGIVLASPLSLGVLNPAVAVGIGLFSWQYLLAPVIGSVLGFGLYKKLN